MVTRPLGVDIRKAKKKRRVSAYWQTHRGKPGIKAQESVYWNAALLGKLTQKKA